MGVLILGVVGGLLATFGALFSPIWGVAGGVICIIASVMGHYQAQLYERVVLPADWQVREGEFDDYGYYGDVYELRIPVSEHKKKPPKRIEVFAHPESEFHALAVDSKIDQDHTVTFSCGGGFAGRIVIG